MRKLKQCSTCAKEGIGPKPVSEFGKRARSADGLVPRCKVHISLEMKAIYALDPMRRRRWHLKGRYNITPEQYDEILASQGGVCAICEDVCKTGRRLAVDHDHETGRVRGLLCANCNIAIGKLQESAYIAGRAADYLSPP
jgi:hypothetical protein